MKYLTPEIFETQVDNIAYIKLLLKSNNINCYKYYYGVCGSLSTELYVIRRYNWRSNYLLRRRIKSKHIYIEPYCAIHKPNKCRKLTPKELFYLQICP